MPSPPIRVGLVGTGLHGFRYARHLLRDIGEGRLVAITRRDRAAGAAQAAELGCHYSPTIEQLVARDDIDAVVVVTPPAAHLWPAMAALRAGKAVLVEKPMTAGASEAEELRQAVRASNRPFMVAQTLRYNSVLTTVRERLGELGKIIQVRMAQRLEPSTLAWQREHQAAGAGSILLTGVHMFDAVRWLFDDEVAQVYCRSERVSNPSQEDFFAASVQLARTGIHADLEVSNYTRSRSCRIEVVGEKGQFLGDYWNHRLAVARGRGEVEEPLPAEVFTVEATMRDFCRRLLAGEGMPITVTDGLRAIEIAEACALSARTDSVIVLPTAAVPA
jgi:predicted dehydrogenase